MAVKQVGVLANFTPSVTPYSNSRTTSATATQGFNIYTCPGATLMSGKLIIANNTGSAATVDIAVTEQTQALQLDAPGNQPGSPATFSAFSFPEFSYTTSVVIEGGGVTGSFTSGESVSWTNSGLTPTAQTAIVELWDSGNSKLWLRNMSHPKGLDLPGDTTVTGANGGTISAGPSYAGTGGTDGWSGRVRYYDSQLGVVYFQNYEYKNNIDYKTIYDMNSEVVAENNNSAAKSTAFANAPVATTQNRYAAAGNTTPATEFIDAAGTELLISAVRDVETSQYIARNVSIDNQKTFELTGLVLGTYQSLYVKSTAAVSATLIGFEDTAEIPS